MDDGVTICTVLKKFHFLPITRPSYLAREGKWNNGLNLRAEPLAKLFSGKRLLKTAQFLGKFQIKATKFITALISEKS